MLHSDIDYHCLTTINEISKFKSHSEIGLNYEVVAFASFTMQKLIVASGISMYVAKQCAYVRM